MFSVPILKNQERETFLNSLTHTNLLMVSYNMSDFWLQVTTKNMFLSAIEVNRVLVTNIAHNFFFEVCYLTSIHSSVYSTSIF